MQYIGKSYSSINCGPLDGSGPVTEFICNRVALERNVSNAIIEKYLLWV